MKRALFFLLIGCSLLRVTAARTVTLGWNYPVADSNVVFNVYEATNGSFTPAALGFSRKNLIQFSASPTWRLIQTLPNNQRAFVAIADRPMCFYTVTASNTVNHLESPK